MAEETRERDKETAERREREKNEALYVLNPGGWMKVNQIRRRKGPKDGENWLAFEEMERIKKEGKKGGS